MAQPWLADCARPRAQQGSHAERGSGLPTLRRHRVLLRPRRAHSGFFNRFSVLTFLTVLTLLTFSTARAGEVIPPVPDQYFNDYARVVSSSTAEQLNQTLKDFERQTSSQILVVVFPKMQSNSSIEDYTVRVAQSWKVGQKGTNNGAVLFVFTQDRKMYLQVGYGLEGALPDALAKQIIDNEIRPRFRNGDYGGGLTAGVKAILAAAKGEYKGSGRTMAEAGRQHQASVAAILIVLAFGFVGLFILLAVVRGMVAAGRRGYWTGGGWTIGSGGWSSGGWSSSSWGGGGGSSSGGGGGSSDSGFSAGGGSFGGGGAGGSW
jgi:uncharacterized protein